MRATQLILIIIGGACLLSCGGGSSNDSSPADSTGVLTLSGRISLGPVSGASVNFYVINADGSRGSLVASTGPLSSSDFTLDLAAPSAPLLAVATGGTYQEEASNTTISLGQRELHAVLRPRLGSQNFALTPLSHIAAARALWLITGGAGIVSAVAGANRDVAKVAGLGDTADITAIRPALGMSADSSPAKLALWLAGLSQLAQQLNLADSLVLAEALALDFSGDGIFNGRNNGAVIPLGAANLSPTAWTTDLYNAQTTFLQGAQNTGGLTTAAHTTLIATPAGTDGEILLAADLNSSVVGVYLVDPTTGNLSPRATFSESGAGYLGLRCQKNINLVLSVNAISGYESLNRYTLDFGAGHLQPLAQTSVTLTSVTRLIWDLASALVLLVDYQAASVTPFKLGALPAASLTAGTVYHLVGGSGPVDAQPDSTEQFLFTLSANASEIEVLHVDSGSASLTLVQSVALPTGLPPLLRLRTDRTGKYVYVLTDSSEDSDGNLTNATLLTYNWDGAHLTLNNMMQLDGEIGPMSVTRDGNFLVLASLSQGKIESYRIDPSTGHLTAISAVGFDDAVAGLITNLTIDMFGQTIFVVGTGTGSDGGGFLATLQLDPGSGQIYFVASQPSATSTPNALALCSQNF